jgi:isoleucyl-tRNA synthetase
VPTINIHCPYQPRHSPIQDVAQDFGYEANIVRALGKIVENNHISKGYKPVHWCTECGSALAEAEVEYKDKKSDAIDVKFTLIDNTLFGVDKPVSIVIP